jgi:adenine nucleotide transporter 17
MAKVRLQAGTSFESEAEDHGSESKSELLNIQDAEEGSLKASYAEVTKSGHISTHTHPSPTKTKKPQRSAVSLLAKVLREEGVLGWYQVRRFKCLVIDTVRSTSFFQGMGAQITKAVLSQALLFTLKDQFERYALVIMLIIRKFRASRS